MIKPIIMGVFGLVIAGLFVAMGWLDGWIYFSVLVMGALLVVNQSWSLFPIGIIGMFSLGVFTKLSWLDPFIFFSVFIVSVIIVAQQIVSRQLDIGHGTSGTGGGK